MPPEQAQAQVRGVLSGLYEGAKETVKVPGQMMAPNPYPAGSEEAAFYDASKTQKATEWAPEMATNVMGTGGVVGLPLQGAETALGAGIIRPRKPPPVIGVLHATGAPTEYSIPKMPPATHDLGFHSTIDPTVSEGYAAPPGFNKKKWMLEPGEEAAGVRTKPFVADVQSALRYPADAGKWNVPSNVILPLEESMRRGFVAPRGLLSDLKNIAGSEKVWQRDFIPMLKDRGYDALFYPHASEITGNKYNTFMIFDPHQTVPRFSPEGQQLIAERGIKNPMQHGWTYGTAEYEDWDKAAKWRLPAGVLKNPAEKETLRRLESENTFKWWENPNDPLFQVQKKSEEAAAKFKTEMDAIHAENVAKSEYWKPYHKYLHENPGLDFPAGFKGSSSTTLTPQGAIDILALHNSFQPEHKLKAHPETQLAYLNTIKQYLPDVVNKYGLSNINSYPELKASPMYGKYQDLIKEALPGFKGKIESFNWFKINDYKNKLEQYMGK